MVKFSAVNRTKDKWEIWEHIEGSKHQICVMTTDDILQLFNETVPRTIEEPYLEGNSECKHTWRPWSSNSGFIRCTRCPAMKKIKKLVPKEYKHD